MTRRALFVATLLLVAGAVPAVATGTGTQADGYAGTYVSFEAAGDALTNYSVAGTTVVDGLKIQSASEASGDGGGGIQVGVSAGVAFDGAALSLETRAETRATIAAESGATITAHDNDRGVLVVKAGTTSQVVRANLSAESSAEQAGEKRVVVHKNGSSGVFLVVGEGNVTVTEHGNVSATLGQNASLVYRQYTGERSQSEKRQERLITSGTATASVYVQQAKDSGSDGKQQVVDVVNYGTSTTVNVSQRAASQVTMTVERATSEGTVIITSVSKQAFASVSDIQVTVDGEAAARADSYAAVEQAAAGGDRSAFLVRQSSSAQASVDVVIGINHFSQRSVTVAGQDQATSTPTETTQPTPEPGTPSPTNGGGPGFGVAAALAALLVSGLARRP